jgi:hypothetical protein
MLMGISGSTLKTSKLIDSRGCDISIPNIKMMVARSYGVGHFSKWKMAET